MKKNQVLSSICWTPFLKLDFQMAGIVSWSTWPLPVAFKLVGVDFGPLPEVQNLLTNAQHQFRGTQHVLSVALNWLLKPKIYSQKPNLNSWRLEMDFQSHKINFQRHKIDPQGPKIDSQNRKSTSRGPDQGSYLRIFSKNVKKSSFEL